MIYSVKDFVHLCKRKNSSEQNPSNNVKAPLSANKIAKIISSIDSGYDYLNVLKLLKEIADEQAKINHLININNIELERLNIGGTGLMFGINLNGRSFIFKPAVARKNHMVSRTARAFIQSGTYSLQKYLDPETAVPCYYVVFQSSNLDVSNKLGSLQEFVSHGKINNIDAIQSLMDFHNGITNNLSKVQLYDIMREYIVDWTIGNFDTFYGNMLIDENGRVRGIDKEQAFKYIYDLSSSIPKLGYEPNYVRYKQPKQIYSHVFDKLETRTLEIDGKKFDDEDFSELCTYVYGLAKKVGQLPDDVYAGSADGREDGMFGKFIRTIENNTEQQNRDIFLNENSFPKNNCADIRRRILDRKNNVPSCIINFFSLFPYKTIESSNKAKQN